MPIIARFDRTFATLEENLAIDEALLLSAEVGESSESLRFWEFPHLAVVLGAGGSFVRDVNEASCIADGVSIQRRPSGGGTVLLGRGCLLFSLVLAYDRALELREVNASYRWILGRVCAALNPIANVELAGISDLAIAGQKVSGNAQQRKAKYLLHHGTLLYDFDLPSIGRYLNAPEREPPYRTGRDHEAFVQNLPVDGEQLKNWIAAAFAAEVAELPQAVLARVPSLIAERYGREEWVRRR